MEEGVLAVAGGEGAGFGFGEAGHEQARLAGFAAVMNADAFTRWRACSACNASEAASTRKSIAPSGASTA